MTIFMVCDHSVTQEIRDQYFMKRYRLTIPKSYAQLFFSLMLFIITVFLQNKLKFKIGSQV